MVTQDKWLTSLVLACDVDHRTHMFGGRTPQRCRSQGELLLWGRSSCEGARETPPPGPVSQCESAQGGFVSLCQGSEHFLKGLFCGFAVPSP